MVCTLIDNKSASLFFSQINFFFRIVSAYSASLQKFLKGKSNAYKQLICIMHHAHFQIRVGVFNCQDKDLFRLFVIVAEPRESTTF